MTDRVTMYTDGACRGNPGPGGWGVLLEYRGQTRELFGGVAEMTTNNRMELMAAIRGLEALKRSSQVSLYTDSQYVLNGVTRWMEGWKARGWRTAARKPVKNDDLWKHLDKLVQQHDVEWIWVRGHTGNAGNERADELANLGIDNL